MANSDFKNKLVDDPNKITSKKELEVKKYTKEFLKKAYLKDFERRKAEHEKRKAVKKASGVTTTELAPPTHVEPELKKEDESGGDELMDMSEEEDVKQAAPSQTPITPLDHTANSEGLKRKRDSDAGAADDDEPATPCKKQRSVTPPVPPPPPPPPLIEGITEDSNMDEIGGYDSYADLSNVTNGNGVVGGEYQDTEAISLVAQPSPCFSTSGTPTDLNGAAYGRNHEIPLGIRESPSGPIEDGRGMEGMHPACVKALEARSGF